MEENKLSPEPCALADQKKIKTIYAPSQKKKKKLKVSLITEIIVTSVQKQKNSKSTSHITEAIGTAFHPAGSQNLCFLQKNNQISSRTRGCPYQR